MAAKMRMPEKSKRYIFSACLFAVLLSAGGCHQNKTTVSEQRWLTDGSITITQPVPAAERLNGGPLLGFFPSDVLRQGNWLLIDTQKHSVSLMDGEKVVASAAGNGMAQLKPGSYEVVHKQRSPLWYAPDSYFQARKLALPADGDVERYRRGALGDFALFLTKDLPLHSGPIWTEEIGGVQIPENDLAKIYYLLPLGSVIEVK